MNCHAREGSVYCDSGCLVRVWEQKMRHVCVVILVVETKICLDHDAENRCSDTDSNYWVRREEIWQNVRLLARQICRAL